ncbi:hypothetical protein Pcinc_042574 [Petrolisthes cinctipes]|uniref:Uncharacterized protein n=1 Tax=Petrolisthes cinctipes TaxID=88211 RepID=A0AAE1EFV2_PETCI|nr:hypothetical protein Pcinc_042574 [Petrolisthes cinctipes]
MPEFISVNDYISEVKDDISSPPTSNFVAKMPLCRQTVNDLEEIWGKDRVPTSEGSATTPVRNEGQREVQDGNGDRRAEVLCPRVQTENRI